MILEAKYQGRWLLVKNEKIIAANKDFREIEPLIDESDPEISIEYFPDENSFF